MSDSYSSDEEKAQQIIDILDAGDYSEGATWCDSLANISDTSNSDGEPEWKQDDRRIGATLLDKWLPRISPLLL